MKASVTRSKPRAGGQSRLRRILFWVHLVSGLIAGVVIAIMSVTGIAIAFEEEILEWVDRKVSTIEPGAGERPAMEDLVASVEASVPEFHTTRVTLHRDPSRALDFFQGRERHLYVNPYTSEAKDSASTGVHEVLHELEEWHRWLAMEGDLLPVGRLITGISNLAFLLLCVTGLYLWFPRKWRWNVVRQSLWFAKRGSAKARDFNWHTVYGFWSLPFLVVLAGTAVAISFAWGHRLVFTLAGEEAPESRNFGMMAVPPPEVPEPPPGAGPLTVDDIFARVAERYPEWQAMSLDPHLPEAGRSWHVDLTVPDYMPSRAYIPVQLDPYTGEILQAVHFNDRSPGLRARVWIRFIHTGAGFGLPGKIVASLATAASLVLVYTGFALSWRRFFGRSKASR